MCIAFCVLLAWFSMNVLSSFLNKVIELNRFLRYLSLCMLYNAFFVVFFNLVTLLSLQLVGCDREKSNQSINQSVNYIFNLRVICGAHCTSPNLTFYMLHLSMREFYPAPLYIDLTIKFFCSSALYLTSPKVLLYVSPPCSSQSSPLQAIQLQSFDPVFGIVQQGLCLLLWPNKRT